MSFPTRLGNALRALADQADRIPTLDLAMTHPNSEHQLAIPLESPAAVRELAAELGLEPRTIGGWPGHKWTTADVVAKPFVLHLFAEHDPYTEIPQEQS